MSPCCVESSVSCLCNRQTQPFGGRSNEKFGANPDAFAADAAYAERVRSVYDGIFVFQPFWPLKFDK